MNNEVKRKMRINQIFLQIHDTGGIETEMLISHCSMTHGLSRRTTREYIKDLTNCKFIKETEGVLFATKKITNKMETQRADFDSIMNKIK